MTAKDLKNALLQEAVQGKLVPQIASEGNARELLEEIRKEKAKLVKAGKIKKEKPLPEITEDEISFDIPENWCWCRLGEICTKLVDGDHNPPAGITEKTEYIMASSRNINDDKLVDLDLVRYLSKEIFEKENERTRAEKGDIFFTGVGTLGRSCIYDGKLNICFQRSVSVLHTEIYNKYLKHCLDNSIIQNFIISNSTGTAQKGFYLNQLAELLIPLPPLAEQKRIVTAIEKFMPLIEEYGKKETKLKAFNEQIGTLTKKAILQEAVQGKLVPQIATEGNAKDLLEEIKKEKAKLIKEGKLKKVKPLPEITENEIPFDIPESWCWCRLEDISTNITAGGDKPFHFSKTMIEKLTIPVISNGEKDDGIFGYTDKATIFEKAITVSGRGNIGFTKVRNEPFMPIVRLITIIFPNILNYEYLEIAISFLVSDGNGSAVQQLTVPMIKPLLIPLPPLAEQKRIVAAIEKILPLCEKLGE